jgi:hypothetical protein
MRAHHQHVVWLGVLQDRVDRLKPGDEYVGFGSGDLRIRTNSRELLRVLSDCTAQERDAVEAEAEAEGEGDDAAPPQVH